MPLATTPTKVVPKEPTVPTNTPAKILDTPYQHSIVDTSLRPDVSLITYISGSNWTVDYYSQVLGRDEGLSSFNPTQLAVYQSYKKISRYKMKLQGDLGFSVDNTDNSNSLTGSAIMYPFVIPNIGDSFIADVGDGQAMVFTLTGATQKILFKETCYDITFISQRYATEEITKELDSRVVLFQHFVDNRYLYGQNPIVITDEYNQLQSLKSDLKKITHQWFTQFFSREYSTMVVPAATFQVYDPLVMRMVQRIFSTSDHPVISNLRYFSCDQAYLDGVVDIYRMLIERDITMEYMCVQKAVWMPVSDFHWDVVLNNVRYSRMSHIVLPSDVYEQGDLENLKLRQERLGLAPENPNPPFAVKGDIPRANEDGYYVLSKAFYDDDSTKMTVLEVIVRTFLEGKYVNPNVLQSLIKQSHQWDRQEKFYFMPLLIIIIRGFLRGL